MRTATRKRSVILSAKKTTVSLEDEFWEALRDVAEGKALSLLNS